MIETEQKPILTPITKKELAAQFNVHYNTIRTWCYKAGIVTNGGLITPKQLKRFYEEYGVPG